MRHPLQTVRALKRPRLLVSAARCGLPEYRREMMLRSALRGQIDGALPGPVQALALLLPVEAALNARRLDRDAAWRPARHVLVLTAIMAEARTAEAMLAPQP